MTDWNKVIRHEAVEFEDSDEEFFSSNHQSHSTIDNMMYEINLAKYYSRMLGVNLPGESSKFPRALKISRAVQTAPDVTGIPQSWLKALCTLVDELHTFTANSINTLCHSPQGTESEVQRPVYFEYVEGFWQSKLIQSVKIPASANDRIIYSGRLEYDLKQVLEHVEKLKICTPYLTECGSCGHDGQRTDKDGLRIAEASLLEKLNTKEMASSGINIPQPVASTSGAVSRYPDSVKGGARSKIRTSKKSYENAKEYISKLPHKQKQYGWGYIPNGRSHGVLSVTSSKTSAYESSRWVHEPMDTSNSCTNVSSHTVKREVSGNRARRPLIPVEDSSDGNAGTSRVVVSVRPKHVYKSTGQQRKEQENSTKTMRKNFIKINIMALREPVIRPSASSGRTRHGCINI